MRTEREVATLLYPRSKQPQAHHSPNPPQMAKPRDSDSPFRFLLRQRDRLSLSILLPGGREKSIKACSDSHYLLLTATYPDSIVWTSARATKDAYFVLSHLLTHLHCRRRDIGKARRLCLVYLQQLACGMMVPHFAADSGTRNTILIRCRTSPFKNHKNQRQAAVSPCPGKSNMPQSEIATQTKTTVIHLY